MANLTKVQREQKYAEARRLAGEGYSRRKIDVLLKQQFGEGIGHAEYTPIYRERVEVVREKEEARPAPQRILRKGRRGRYDWLIDRHFTDDEATQLSKLRNIQSSKGIAKMVSVRQSLWEQFIKVAASHGWNKEQRRDGWRRGLARWYRRNGYITKKFHKGKKRPSAWMWYKSVQRQLPIEDQDDTPRLHDRGFTTNQHITPQLVDWTQNLLSIRRVMENPRYRNQLPTLRQEERRVLGKIREAKSR